MRTSIILAACTVFTFNMSIAIVRADDVEDDSKAALTNQLGIFEYCQSKGYIDESAVKAERSVIASGPGDGSTAEANAAEALGKQGTLSMMGITRSISDQASAQNESVADLCKNMASIAVQLGAAFQQMPTMPAFPSPSSRPHAP